jgi:hypothetical protein
MKKGQKTEDKLAESWGQVGWVLGWRDTTARAIFLKQAQVLLGPMVQTSSVIHKPFGGLPTSTLTPSKLTSPTICFQ